jgi:hypothetical protein
MPLKLEGGGGQTGVYDADLCARIVAHLMKGRSIWSHEN